MVRDSIGQGQEISPTVAVGKNGVTDQVIEEIVRQISKKKTIKVKLHGESKILRSEIARELANRSGTRLVELRGFTVILTRKIKK
ncbi:MAG TPA: YhbY family RNA-binding protein [Euryarchaeota archaeon]|nr:YhbY family RNA-binding protein [Euryarchaeota archaeon]